MFTSEDLIYCPCDFTDTEKKTRFTKVFTKESQFVELCDALDEVGVSSARAFGEHLCLKPGEITRIIESTDTRSKYRHMINLIQHKQEAIFENFMNAFVKIDNQKALGILCKHLANYIQKETGVPVASFRLQGKEMVDISKGKRGRDFVDNSKTRELDNQANSNPTEVRILKEAEVRREESRVDPFPNKRANTYSTPDKRVYINPASARVEQGIEKWKELLITMKPDDIFNTDAKWEKFRNCFTSDSWRKLAGHMGIKMPDLDRYNQVSKMNVDFNPVKRITQDWQQSEECNMYNLIKMLKEIDNFSAMNVIISIMEEMEKS